MFEAKNPIRAARPESPVPEALGRLLSLLAKRIDPGSVDRIWIFPPLVKGRKEWGLVAVSCLEDAGTLRTLVTGRYVAEMTGRGMVFEPEFMSEGSASRERLPSIMDGVVRRSDLQLGVPREVGIGGDSDKFRALLTEHGWKEPPEGSAGS
ncbi:MAG: hypothetical protein HKO65_09500 [Gemmatimonadetes bacterium]|nr:hypothetical protein [Gemmatimonadota bacterium]NNM05326.1 hypothetical protein [Gemmatimonadota bacterium]